MKKNVKTGEKCEKKCENGRKKKTGEKCENGRKMKTGEKCEKKCKNEKIMI